MSTQKLATQYQTDDKRLSIGWIVRILAILSIPIAFFGNWCWSYLTNNQIALIALDSNSGKFLWSSGFDNELTRSIATERDRVFVSTLAATNRSNDLGTTERKYQYQIVAFAAKSGQKLWSFDPPSVSGEELSGMSRSPIRAKGERLWVNTVSDRLPSQQPILAPGTNGQLVKKTPNTANIRQGQILEIDARTGKLNRSIDRNWHVQQLDLDGITIDNSITAILRFNPALDVSLEASNSDTGKQLWKIPVAAAATQSTAVVFNHYRLFSTPKTIFLFDKATNKLSGSSWKQGRSKFQVTLKTTLDPMQISSKYRLANDARFQPVSNYLSVNDSTVYSLNRDRTIGAFDAHTGTRRWEIELPPHDRCLYPASITAARSGLYLVCMRFENAYVGKITTTKFSLDGTIGKKVWFARYPYRLEIK
ncbi:PQQ-binding-like beta-propeller repeat protein, partial [Chamaesiphon sp. OTE_20_metabat_361]|uniref:outer membrane protein assembly factor BamB family protein n=1 Tax=Chamaesiphon sp. OTE_20_metabat_361 TaxID=2964689 RepID=UPI00286B397A